MTAQQQRLLLFAPAAAYSFGQGLGFLSNGATRNADRRDYLAVWRLKLRRPQQGVASYVAAAPAASTAVSAARACSPVAFCCCFCWDVPQGISSPMLVSPAPYNAASPSGVKSF